MSPEQIINDCIKNSDYNTFEHNYNLITPTPYYKSIMLMYLLSCNRRSDYYKLLQTIGLDELSNEYINFIVEFDLLINTCNLKKINELSKSCRYNEFTYFINEIYNNLLKDNEDNITTIDSSTKYTIQDMMYIINNSK